MYTVYRCMIGNGLLSQAQEESFGGATECTPCSLGSAATQQLNPTVSATAGQLVVSSSVCYCSQCELHSGGTDGKGWERAVLQ